MATAPHPASSTGSSGEMSDAGLANDDLGERHSNGLERCSCGGNRDAFGKRRRNAIRVSPGSPSTGYTAPMLQIPISRKSTRPRVDRALREGFARQHPGVALDARGYVSDFRQTLLPMVSAKDFEDDLRAGLGNEMLYKFRAVHSSAALTVNCFAPFRRRVKELPLPCGGAFKSLRFERKCPTGIFGRPPNIDVLLESSSEVVGIESKLTEHLVRRTPHRKKFSPAYQERFDGESKLLGYVREMNRIRSSVDNYRWLDASQLIKHAFGLAIAFPNRSVTLLYLFWEPSNQDLGPVFETHREEVAAFGERVAGYSPKFVAMSYPELWQSWHDGERVPDWLLRHLGHLRNRYLVQI